MLSFPGPLKKMDANEAVKRILEEGLVSYLTSLGILRVKGGDFYLVFNEALYLSFRSPLSISEVNELTNGLTIEEAQVVPMDIVLG